jgi:hypothetical protein
MLRREGLQASVHWRENARASRHTRAVLSCALAALGLADATIVGDNRHVIRAPQARLAATR